jgi:hypothetical protein
MASRSLSYWLQTSAWELDQLENAHRAVGGGGRGRRFTTQQVNQSYSLLLSSHFQRFCRDLHTEAVDHLLGPVVPGLLAIAHSALTRDRKLDRGNPTPGNIGTDFGRLGMTFWEDVKALDARNAARLKKLELMGHWRNAIAHQDFGGHAMVLGARSELTLSEVRGFRRMCAGLAPDFDRAVLAHLKAVGGPASGWP